MGQIDSFLRVFMGLVMGDTVEYGVESDTSDNYNVPMNDMNDQFQTVL